MLFTFLHHQWIQFWRSRNKGVGLASQIILGLFMAYLLLIALFLGYALPDILARAFGGQSALRSFNGLLLYYFAIDLILRLQLQELPTLSIVPYLHLRIKKATIVQFLNIKALFSFFNLWPLILFFPFCVSVVYSDLGTMPMIAYMVTLLSLIFFNNYLALYLKRQGTANSGYLIGGFASIVAIMLCDYYGLFSLMSLSDGLFRLLANRPYLCVSFVLAAACVFWWNSRYITDNLYEEEMSGSEKEKSSTDMPFFDRFGQVGDLAALELKLILRHKRSRSTVMTGLIFMAYGFIFYKKEALASDSFGLMLFAALFMTGTLILFYGQFMFAWQSAHFDGLLVNRLSIESFLKAKLLLFTIYTIAVTAIISLYGLISWKILLIQLVAALYNIGFGSIVVLYMATFNYKRLDLSSSSAMNWQGVGASQWLMMLPYLLIPYFIYVPFKIFGNGYWALLALGIFGALMWLMRNFWLGFLVKAFEKKRYKIAEGFRE
ncbi:DUF5687 family protein [Olivibacter sitiensis]|uniref:DUF5687 family protein n=1 Tax=Olivibacter sitiensis TaxID=376470 RepID=UPI00041C7DCB|nr:DUF5687 family protein [Olivibacter sitiensis]